MNELTENERKAFELIAKQIVDADQSINLMPLLADDMLNGVTIKLMALGYLHCAVEFGEAWLMLTELGCDSATAAGINVPWHTK